MDSFNDILNGDLKQLLDTKWCYFCNRQYPKEENIRVRLIDRKSEHEIEVDSCKKCVPAPDDTELVIVYI